MSKHFQCICSLSRTEEENSGLFFIQNVPGGKVNIQGGHSIGHSKQNSVCVLFRTVSEIEIFHCTVPKLLIRKRYYVLFLRPVFIFQVTKLVQFT
jgi:hypothetical protein